MKRTADRILEESGIVPRLSALGSVKIAGSHALDVVVRPDIDLFVIADAFAWEDVLAFHRDLMDARYFREIDFVNWVDFSDPARVSIKGYYFQPWVPADGELWKMDIWLTTPEYDRSAELTERFRALLADDADGAKRAAILRIKEAARKGGKYLPGIDGKTIYRAVLEQGIRDPEAFLEMQAPETAGKNETAR